MSLPLAVVGIIRDAVFAAVTLVAISVLLREGGAGLARKVLGLLRHLHGVEDLIRWLLRREVKSFLKQVDPQSFGTNKKKMVKIPEKGN